MDPLTQRERTIVSLRDDYGLSFYEVGKAMVEPEWRVSDDYDRAKGLLAAQARAA